MEKDKTFAIYFSFAEFMCKCGCGLCNMSPEFIHRLDRARRLAGVPFHISSGFRCARHNEKVGGVSESSHVKGHAADIVVFDAPSRLKILRALLDAGFDRIGIGKAFVHVDDDPAKEPDVMWVYADK